MRTTWRAACSAWRAPRRLGGCTLPVALLLAGAGCGGSAPAPDAADAAGGGAAAVAAGPGLHTLMLELQHRHASLWFAGAAANWPLADYLLHEMEELIERIEEAHPSYRGIPVAAMLGEATHPAIAELEAAVGHRDAAAFEVGFDRLTTACNACHVATDRGALVMQRPTTPPLTNLRYDPPPADR